ncbi:RluA family pseudouridine synthase [Bartonella tamiae]|uniref:RluA family pseudouridine synthase n=1 Tax=Bartonella tamiae TaxID=373638 RepID=UPI0018C8CFB0|nr:RluA family pseudouridine synthase [Bartonella tamiae]
MTYLLSDESAKGQRIDQWLSKQLQADYSRSRLQALIRQGQIKIDNVVVLEPKIKLRGGENIQLNLPPLLDAEPQGENIPLDILYEDNDIIVVNKPAGLVVHPGNGNTTGTMVNALIFHCGHSLSGIGGVKRPGIVHRLDKDTSGVMVVAKNDNAHKNLSEQFADHGRSGALKRQYHALIWGTLERGRGRIETHLGRSQSDRTRQAVVSSTRSDARYAVTHFHILEKFGTKNDATAVASLVECQLETGRTHQIRVHMAHIGHPLIGDMDYGRAYKTKTNKLDEAIRNRVECFSRQALHAASLTFTHPSNGDIMHFQSDIPKDMAALIEVFRLIE